MLILLDENLLSKKLKKPFLDVVHTVQNVEDMGWRGTKDRELLALANIFPFDVFITSDKNLPYQQNLQNLALRVVGTQRQQYPSRSFTTSDGANHLSAAILSSFLHHVD